jgi:fluoride ion exporter CrcB/FEX
MARHWVTLEIAPHPRTVGILGGFTTFSSFMLDTFTLGYGGRQAFASANLVVQNAVGLALVWVGCHAAIRIR